MKERIALAIMVIPLVGLMLVSDWMGAVNAQQASPGASPTAKPLKNPTAMHHHYDRRRPHKGAKPQLKNPQQAPD